MSAQGKIIEAYTVDIGEDYRVIAWESDKGYFGRLTIFENNRHDLEIETEMLSLETVAEILAKWIETNQKTDNDEKE